jgi:hypothetical protein
VSFRAETSRRSWRVRALARQRAGCRISSHLKLSASHVRRARPRALQSRIVLSAPNKTAAQAGEKEGSLPNRISSRGARRAPPVSRAAVNASEEFLGQHSPFPARTSCPFFAELERLVLILEQELVKKFLSGRLAVDRNFAPIQKLCADFKLLPVERESPFFCWLSFA